VDKIVSSLPSLISSSSISSYQLIQLVAINLYAVFHSRRRLSSSMGTAAEFADDYGPHQNGDVADNDVRLAANSTQHAAYNRLMFGFTGLISCPTTHLENRGKSEFNSSCGKVREKGKVRQKGKVRENVFIACGQLPRVLYCNQIGIVNYSIGVC